MEKQKAEFSLNSTHLIAYAFKKRWPLIILTALGAIVSIIVSLNITPKFKSTVVMFPAPGGSVSQSLLTDNYTNSNIFGFGEEEDAEKLLQVLNSEVIKGKIFNKYNLAEHYEIDAEVKFPKTALLEEFNSNVSFRRTEFMSVEVEVLDKDPVLAANMANDIAAMADTVMNQIKQERSRQALRIVQDAMARQREVIQTLEDSLVKVRRLGVIDLETQSEVLSDRHAEALIKGNYSAAAKIEKKLDALKEYGAAYENLTEVLEYERLQYTDLNAKYAEAKVEAEEYMPHMFIVDRAYPAEKKAYPVRWLIVVLSTIGSFIMALLALIIADNYRYFIED